MKRLIGCFVLILLYLSSNIGLQASQTPPTQSAIPIVHYPVITADNLAHLSLLAVMGAVENTNILRLSPPDGKLLAVGRNSGVTLYSTAQAGEQPGVSQYFKTDNPVTKLTFSADGTFLAVGTRKGSISVWNVQTGAQRVVRPDGNPIRALAFSADGTRLAVGQGNGTLYAYTWNLQDNPPAQVFSGQSNAVVSIAFLGDSNTLVSADPRYGEVGSLLWVWDTASGNLLSRDAVCSSANGGACPSGTQLQDTPAFSSDGRILAWPADAHVIIWDVNAKKVKKVLDGGCSSAPVFSPDSSLVGCPGSTDEGTFLIWNLANSGAKQNLRAVTLAYGWAEDSLLATDGLHTLNKNPSGGWTVWQEGMAQPHEILGDVTYLLAGNNGTILGKTGQYGGAGLWDVRSGASRFLFPSDIRIEDDYVPAGQYVEAGAFSPDGRFIAFTQGEQVVFFDTLTGKLNSVMHSALYGYSRTVFGPDGLTLISYAPVDEVIRRWDIITGKVQAVVYPQGKVRFHHYRDTVTPTSTVPSWYESDALSVDGSRLLGWQGDPQQGIRVVVWDTITGKQLSAFSLLPEQMPMNNAIGQQLALSSDGSTLAVGDATSHLWFGIVTAGIQITQTPLALWNTIGSKVTLWDTTNGKPRVELSGNYGPVNVIAFSRSGKLAAAITGMDTSSSGIQATPAATSQATPPPAGTQTPVSRMLVVWDAATGYQLASLPVTFDIPSPPVGVFVPPFQPNLAFSHDDSLLFVGSYKSAAVQVFGVED